MVDGPTFQVVRRGDSMFIPRDDQTGQDGTTALTVHDVVKAEKASQREKT